MNCKKKKKKTMGLYVGYITKQQHRMFELHNDNIWSTMSTTFNSKGRRGIMAIPSQAYQLYWILRDDGEQTEHNKGSSHKRGMLFRR
jgi:hypothetical protein